MAAAKPNLDPNSQDAPFFYSVREVAQVLRTSPAHAAELFAYRPGVVDIGIRGLNPSRTKRRYRSLRIPCATLQKFLRDRSYRDAQHLEVEQAEMRARWGD
jgi:hypothetical protein